MKRKKRRATASRSSTRSMNSMNNMPISKSRSSKSSPETSEYDAYGQHSRSDDTLDLTLSGGDGRSRCDRIRKSTDHRGDYTTNGLTTGRGLNESEEEDMDLDEDWDDEDREIEAMNRIVNGHHLGSRQRLKSRIRCDSNSEKHGTPDIHTNSNGTKSGGNSGVLDSDEQEEEDVFSFTASNCNDPLNLKIKVTSVTKQKDSRDSKWRKSRGQSASSQESKQSSTPADITVCLQPLHPASQSTNKSGMTGQSSATSVSNPDPQEGLLLVS